MFVSDSFWCLFVIFAGVFDFLQVFVFDFLGVCL